MFSYSIVNFNLFDLYHVDLRRLQQKMYDGCTGYYEDTCIHGLVVLGANWHSVDFPDA